MDRTNPTAKSPMNPGVAVSLLAGLAAVAGWLRSDDPEARAIAADPEALRRLSEKIDADIRRQYQRKLMWQAFELRGRWRKADLPRLRHIFGGEHMPATHRAIERLAASKGKLGRGVVTEPDDFGRAFAAGLAHMVRTVEPATSAAERRELHKAMPKHAVLIEAAFRGQYAMRRRRLPIGPRRKASELAEEDVAEAAGISRAMVHELCQQVRDERRRSGTTEPAITAVDLKKHIDLIDLK